MSITLRDARSRFTRLTAEFVHWFYQQDWSQYGSKIQLAFDEGKVANPRPFKSGGLHYIGEDRVHNSRGNHPDGLAIDLVIWIDGEYVSSGSHPIWPILDRYCR